MTEIISFPGLGLEFEVSRVAFMVGDRPVYWYGVIIALAFLLGAAYALRRAPVFGLDADRVMDVILGAVVLGIVGARLYYVAFQWDTYSRDPITILYLWMGGLAIYGAVIGGVAGALLMCRLRKVPVLPMLDLGLSGLILGQAIGRWGNFFNMEAFGSNTTSAWGMTSPSIILFLKQNISKLSALGVSVDPSVPVHPTFFYESMWCLFGFLLMALFVKRRRYDGQLALLYFGWYGLGRFFIEGLRTDSLLVGTLRVSQILALVCLLAAAISLVMMYSRIRRAHDPGYLPLYVSTPESREAMEAAFRRNLEKSAKAKKEAAPAGEVVTPEPEEITEPGQTEETADPKEPANPEEPEETADPRESEESTEREEPAQPEKPEEAAEGTGDGKNA